MTKIVSVGEICLDIYLNQNKTFVGGRSLNFAVQAKRCGAAVSALISRVGQDEAGQRTLGLLAREGVDHAHVRVMAGSTSTCDIELLPNADRLFPLDSFYLNVLAGMRLNENELAYALSHDVVMTIFDTNYPSPIFYQLMAANFAGLRVTDFDAWEPFAANPEPLFAAMRLADVAFLSGDEATVEALRPFSASYGGLVVVTLGANGSVGLQNGRFTHYPAIPVANPIDATGCGDAYQAEFMVEYVRSGSIEQALQRGTEQATAVLQHLGAISGAEENIGK